MNLKLYLKKTETRKNRLVLGSCSRRSGKMVTGRQRSRTQKRWFSIRSPGSSNSTNGTQSYQGIPSLSLPTTKSLLSVGRQEANTTPETNGRARRGCLETRNPRSCWKSKLSQGSQAKHTVAIEAKRGHLKTLPKLPQSGSILC